MFGIQHPIIQRGMHIAGFSLMLACALLAASDAHAQPGGPLETAVKYFEAGQASQCGKVWPMYSAATQENIRAAAHRRERERHGLPQPWKPEEQGCAVTGTLKRGSAHLARQQGDEAVVTAEFTVRVSRRKYDYFPPATVVTRELRLVREAGAWRVELPRIKIGPGSDRRLVEVGPVDVYYPVKFFAGLHNRLEATAVVRASRDALEPALRDPQSWARVLPSVNAAQPLERAGELERVQLLFAEPDRSITVTTRLSGKQADSPMRETSLQWEVEGSNKAPVYLRGSWRLEPHQDGSTRVTLLLLIDTKQWPGNITEGIFSAERIAEAVLGLEKAARKSGP